MDKFLQIAPHSLALVLSRVCKGADEDGGDPPPSPPPSTAELQHRTGYEVFASFKAVNMLHFWNKALTQALSEIFFLGWIDEHVLLIQGKEVHLQVLRNGWTRRTLKPPQGFDFKCIGGYVVVVPPRHVILSVNGETGADATDARHQPKVGDLVLFHVDVFCFLFFVFFFEIMSRNAWVVETQT